LTQVQALAVTDHLLDLGADVELVTPLPHVGSHVAGVTWPHMMQLVSRKGARLHPNLMPAQMDGEVELANASAANRRPSQESRRSWSLGTRQATTLSLRRSGLVRRRPSSSPLATASLHAS
jgi:hypothetical protein